MKSFTGVERVRVKNPIHPLRGMTGHVVRRMAGSRAEAWVEIEGELPESCRLFPATDSLRAQWVRLHPRDCEKVTR